MALHIADCAPALLFRRPRPSDQSAAARIHRSYRDEQWRDPGNRPVWLLLAAIGGWPPYIAGAMIRATWLNGAAILAHTGKSLARQMREQCELAVAHGIPPRWYYTFELFDDRRRRKAGQYLLRGETKRGVYRVLKRSAGAALSPLTDKVAFAARCHDRGLRAVPVILALEPGASVADGDPGVRLPKVDLFVKPNHGKGGRGAERWDYRHDDVYEDASGTQLREAELVRHIRRLPFAEGVIVQPRRVNHPDVAAVSNGALATVRIVTCRNERGEFEATNAVLRMAQGRNRVVDNFHAGGLAAAVDLASGALGPATDLGRRPTTGWRETHPNGGARIVGRRLPLWRETLALAVRAHAEFADRILIGWDVGIMEDGPELVEGNGAPDLDIIQRTHREPIGNARLGELLAFHLRARPAAISATKTATGAATTNANGSPSPSALVR
jgi:hypothetical protein